MIYVAGDIAAGAAIDRPFTTNCKKILAVSLVDFLVRNIGPGVFNNPFALWNGLRRKQPQPGFCPFNRVRNTIARH
jgi:hypothetical protein